MANYRYHLSTRAKKYICPECQHKTFTPYVDDNNEPVNIELYGRCDRENNCGYIKYPTGEQYTPSLDEMFKPRRTEPKPVFYLQRNYIEHTTKEQARDNNPLFKFLCGVFGSERTTQVFRRYHVGTDNKNNSFSIWWQVDEQGNVRDGHCMAYKPNGHRLKTDEQGQRVYSEDWTGAKLKRANIITSEQHESIERCLFGLHLLSEPNNQDKPVYLFESEKTALVASIVHPNVLCMATCGCGGFSSNRLKPLSGRKVVFFTDDDIAGNKWTDDKARQLKTICNLTSLTRSNWLDGIGYEYETGNGWDYCDHILKLMNDQQARTAQHQATTNQRRNVEPTQEHEPVRNDTSHTTTSAIQPISTDDDLPFTGLIGDVPF